METENARLKKYNTLLTKRISQEKAKNQPPLSLLKVCKHDYANR